MAALASTFFCWKTGVYKYSIDVDAVKQHAKENMMSLREAVNEAHSFGQQLLREEMLRSLDFDIFNSSEAEGWIPNVTHPDWQELYHVLRTMAFGYTHGNPNPQPSVKE